MADTMRGGRVRSRQPGPGSGAPAGRPGTAVSGARVPADSARVVRRAPGFAGCLGAVVLFCLSLTPSLLPRHWALQGLLSGVTMVCGYGTGAVAGALLRRYPRLPEPRGAWWLALALAGGGAAAGFLQLAGDWQAQIRQTLGMAPQAWPPALVAGVALAVAAVLVAAARTVRLATGRLAGRLRRWLPTPVAVAVAVTVMATAGFGAGYGVGFPGFVAVSDRLAATADAGYPTDLAPPSSPYRSGGPGSLVSWESLGAQGRAFVTGAVPYRQLTVEHGAAARPPVRVYVGRSSAPDLGSRAALAVRELERAGGLNRAVVAVVVTTGTGWVNPQLASALEHLHGGDTAIVAVQYSYLPSWVAFVSERAAAARSATALLSAVQRRLATTSAPRRPALLVAGESLGAYGIAGALRAAPELRAGLDGVLLVGPPHGTALAGVDGAQAGAADPAVVTVRNHTDPIGRWNPQLIFRRPPWLRSPIPELPDRMRWYPVVTFWQVTVDLLSSTAVPDGYGHAYGGRLSAAWARLMPPVDRHPGAAGPDLPAVSETARES